MDGPFYVDTRAPHISADVAAVTLATTAVALVPVTNLPILGSNYFSFVGKCVRMTMFGRMTTAATPGNGTFSLWWGNGASANGTSFVASPASTLVASQTNMSWRLEMTIRCRAIGSSGSLIAMGQINYNTSVVAAGFALIPSTAPAAQTLDLTQANVISPQYLRSGSTAETMQVHELIFEALN